MARVSSYQITSAGIEFDLSAFEPSPDMPTLPGGYTQEGTTITYPVTALPPGLGLS